MNKQEIFYPHKVRRLYDLNNKNATLVHYTTMESAYKILENKCLWMRNTMLMNDVSEVENEAT